MKAQRSSLYIKSEGPNKSAIAKGFVWLLELGDNDVNKRSVLVAVPVKSNLQGAISSVIGETHSKMGTDLFLSPFPSSLPLKLDPLPNCSENSFYKRIASS